MRPNPRLGRQHGQALVEVVVYVLLVLIPTLFVAWIMFAHSQARTAALNGARYAAWERIVWCDPASMAACAAHANRSGEDIANFMVDRVIAHPDRPIDNAPNPESTKDSPSTAYLLHDGRNLVDLQQTPELLRYEEKDEAATSLMSRIDSAKTALGSGVRTFNGGETLDDKGIRVATVAVKLKTVGSVEGFDALNLTIRQQAAVVTDSWSAGGKASEERRTQPMVSKIAEDGYIAARVRGFYSSNKGFAKFNDKALDGYDPGIVKGDLVMDEARKP